MAINKTPAHASGGRQQTASCVGHFTTAGRIAKGDQLSVRYLWMAAKERDEFTDRPTTFIEPDGTSVKAALDIARSYGIVPERRLSFDPPVLYASEVATFYTLAARLRIATYHNLGSDLTEWRTWLASQGPIVGRLDCDNTWMNAKATKGKLGRFNAASADGGHAVTIVGYSPTTFTIRNSWGTTDWGDKGYAYASNAYAKAVFTEAYGVTLQANHVAELPVRVMTSPSHVRSSTTDTVLLAFLSRRATSGCSVL